MARAIQKLGVEEAKRVQDEYKKCNNQQQEGIILTLIHTGLSGIEVKALLAVVGYRVTRLQKRSKMSEEEIQHARERPCQPQPMQLQTVTVKQ